ncbi:hypothetical protein FACS189462_4170 [Spirochaetia bacterium]|nr:hypothetical protein FACS189462_4170 [Spirochaetia bacterium]
MTKDKYHYIVKKGRLMKIMIKFVLVLMIAPHVFADENVNEIKDAVFPWQLVENQTEFMDINFISLNSIFFYNRNNVFTKISFDVFDYGKNGNNQNRSNKVIPVKNETAWVKDLILLVGQAIIWGDFYNNPNKYRYLNDEWNRERR